MRLTSGRLIEIAPSVYAVGHAAPNQSASWMEAVLYAGPGAALHSLATLALRGLRAPAPVIHVATPRRIRKRGLIVPHYLHLPDDELEYLDELERVRPLVNVPRIIDGDWIEPDLCWPDLRLISEIDSRTHHDTADGFEEDRLRDWRYEAGGWRHLRVTAWQVHRDRKRLGERLCALIPRRIAGTSPLGNEKNP